MLTKYTYTVCKSVCSTMASATIQAAKVSLRKEIHNKILAIPAEEKKRQSENVFRKLLELPAFQTSKRISVYLSTEHELSTEPIIKHIFENGKSCFVPRYNKSIMEMVKLNSMKDWEELPVTKWNIKQPNLSEKRENAIDTGGLDLVIVPGMAFTINGVRMGHGKGYYDTFLSALQNTHPKRAVTVALAFTEQVLEEIPRHEHDVKIDIVLHSDS
ncbi:hypothetical protein ILUMI_20121 [Ignelater luminosus]|uniref:5-formyltetrahydrofolate cyclo-ligase n=1 Tax=Ignelater luminosus TaxID=2038154 RepID=A0A8K0CIT9_IGNLU|nr:hypothetical protein ILUMI_20121 [Ignelater luminosus]